MKKNLFYVISLFLICIAGLVFVFSRNKSVDGKILGASVNSFYSEKTVRVSSLPVKHPGVKDPNILSETAVLLYEPNKYILFSQNENASVPVASITKVMTALVTLDIYKLDDIVEVPKDATEIIGSKILLKQGEKITVENLLYGLLLNSGNDAAKTLATGKVNETQFMELMNKKAHDLGLSQTLFKDEAGLNDQGHSSAKDLAILFSYALKNSEFEKVINTPEKNISSVDGGETHILKNSTRLTTGEIPLDGIIGGKTGFTPDAGHGMVSAASRNGVMLICVILKTNDSSPSASAIESKKMLTWGFDSFDF